MWIRQRPPRIMEVYETGFRPPKQVLEPNGMSILRGCAPHQRFWAFAAIVYSNSRSCVRGPEQSGDQHRDSTFTFSLCPPTSPAHSHPPMECTVTPRTM